MSIILVKQTDSLPVNDDSWSKLVESDKFYNLSLNNPLDYDFSSDTIKKGVLVSIGGSNYQAISDTSITGTPSDYVKITPDLLNDTADASYVANLDDVTWNDTYNFWNDINGNSYLFNRAKAVTLGLIGTPKTKEGKNAESGYFKEIKAKSIVEAVTGGGVNIEDVVIKDGYVAKKTFLSIDQLRGFVGQKSGQIAITSGYYQGKDGGGGSPKYWSVSSTAIDNGIDIFKPDSVDASDPGRWLVDYDSVFDARWGGVMGDASDETSMLEDIAALYSSVILQGSKEYNLSTRIEGNFISYSSLPSFTNKQVHVTLLPEKNGVTQGIFKTTIEHRVGKLLYKKDSSGKANVITDLSPFLPVEGVSPKVYYVSRSGDGSDGLSWATAFNEMYTALSQFDVDKIYVDGTDRFTLREGFNTYSGSRDISIYSIGGRAIFNAQTEETWSSGTQANTFVSSTLGGTPVQAIDTDKPTDYGGFKELERVSTELEVSSTPGSWTVIGSGSSQKAVVRLYDDATPDNDRTWICRSYDNRFSGVSCKMYINGIDFYSCSAAAFSVRGSSVSSVITVEDCGFYNAPSGDGFQVKGVGLAIAINCKASLNGNDGFNYHAENNDIGDLNPHILEVDCFAARNLETGTGNGSTGHEAVKVIRVNCDYYDNNGPGVADIDTVQSFNICCTSNYNGLTLSDQNCDGFQFNGANVYAVCDSLSAHKNAAGGIVAQSTAEVLYRDCFPPPVDDSGSATVRNILESW